MDRGYRDENVLVLQGGGALGAYQAGVYRGAGRARHGARLGRRHLDRRDQRRADRRQPAGAPRRAAARVLGALISAVAAALPPVAGRDAGANCCNESSATHGDAVRRARLLRAARAAGAVPAARHARRDQLLRHRAAARARSSGWSTSTCSTPGAMRLSVGAVNVRTGNFAYFDTAHASASTRATSWRAARCRRAFRRSRSTASTTGTAASSRTRRCSTCSTSPARGAALVFQVDLFARARRAAGEPRRGAASARRTSATRAGRA